MASAKLRNLEFTVLMSQQYSRNGDAGETTGGLLTLTLNYDKKLRWSSYMRLCRYIFKDGRYRAARVSGKIPKTMLGTNLHEIRVARVNSLCNST